MSDANEIQAAVERLRTNAYAECDEDLHQCMDDCRTVAMAYLALGERQMEVVMRSTDGKPASIITSFIREAEWMADMERRVDALLSDGFLEDEEAGNVERN